MRDSSPWFSVLALPPQCEAVVVVCLQSDLWLPVGVELYLTVSKLRFSARHPLARGHASLSPFVNVCWKKAPHSAQIRFLEVSNRYWLEVEISYDALREPR